MSTRSNQSYRFVYTCLRSLRCDRTRIHRNLFVAIIIHVAILLIVQIDQSVARTTGEELAGVVVKATGTIYDTVSGSKVTGTVYDTVSVSKVTGTLCDTANVSKVNGTVYDTVCKCVKGHWLHLRQINVSNSNQPPFCTGNARLDREFRETIAVLILLVLRVRSKWGEELAEVDETR